MSTAAGDCSVLVGKCPGVSQQWISLSIFSRIFFKPQGFFFSVTLHISLCNIQKSFSNTSDFCAFLIWQVAFSCEGVKDVLLLKFRKRKQTSTFCWRQKASCSSWWSSMAWQAGAWGFGFSHLFFLLQYICQSGHFSYIGNCNRNVCSVCLFSNRYWKIWGWVLLLTLNYNLTALSVSQGMHVERGHSKDFYAECLLGLWYSCQFSGPFGSAEGWQVMHSKQRGDHIFE